MPPDAVLVFVILGLTLALFVTDWLRLDVVALMSLFALILTGVLTPAQGLAGFSDPLVLTIASLFIVSSALFRTGVAGRVGLLLERFGGRTEQRMVLLLMLATAALSSVISSTGTAAMMLPVAATLARRAGISVSRLLMPVATAALVGGMLTLIATPPNLTVAEQLAANGFAPFGFFSFTPLGLAMVAVAVAYMVLVGRRLIPARAPVVPNDGAEERHAGFTGDEPPPGTTRRGGTRAVVILVAMLVAMSTGWLSPVVAAGLAALAMVLSGCLSMPQAYRSIHWDSVVLIAAMLPMATALQVSGGVALAVDGVVALLGTHGAWVTMAGIAVLASGVGLLISNTATAVLMAPIAFQVAMTMDVSPYPMLMAVALGASTDFATPVGSPVNTMMVGPGRYRFMDYVKVGLPLQLLVTVATVALVPLFFPF